MKELIKKTIISIIAILILLSGFAIPNTNFVYAQDTSTSQTLKQREEEAMQQSDNIVGKILDGVVGIVTWIPRAIVFGVVSVLRVLIFSITAIGGAGAWNIESIIFTDASENSGTGIVSIDFFNLTSGGQTMQQLKQGVAIWYYSLRNLAAVILLGILIYVGIRMAISTVADDEAKYKKMFKDWVTSFIMLFLMHYLMIATIEMNKVLVGILYNARGSGDGHWDSYLDLLASDVFHWSFTTGTGALIIYTMMIGITLLYLIMYIKRMLTVAFLIIISPLITITYSIDKMRDNRSQAFDTWLKEFVYNILIQPFHCIIYLVFIQTALKLMHDSQSMASAVLAVIMIVFMHTAEDIVKQIFNFQSASLGKAVANAALITTGVNMIKNRGKSVADKNSNSGKVEDMSEKIGNYSKNTSKNAEQNMAATSESSSSQPSQTPPVQQISGNNTEQTSQTEPPEQQRANSSDGQPSGENDSKQQNITGPKTLKGKFKGGAKAVADWGKGALKATAKAATPKNLLKTMTMGGLYMAGAALMLSTGQPGAMISGIEAVNSIRKGTKAKMAKKLDDKVTEKNTHTFAGVYRAFQQNTDRSPEDISMLTNDILTGKVSERDLNENEREYRKHVLAMSRSFAEGEKEEGMAGVLESANDRNFEATPGIDYNSLFTPPKAATEPATSAPEIEQLEATGEQRGQQPKGNSKDRTKPKEKGKKAESRPTIVMANDGTLNEELRNRHSGGKPEKKPVVENNSENDDTNGSGIILTGDQRGQRNKKKKK